MYVIHLFGLPNVAQVELELVVVAAMAGAMAVAAAAVVGVREFSQCNVAWRIFP
jgi:hypothetical protein